MQENLANEVEDIARRQMIQPLIDVGVKFNEKDALFVTNHQSGQTIWLEKGSPMVDFNIFFMEIKRGKVIKVTLKDFSILKLKIFPNF